ncbi:DUF896 domain-containing protein [Mycoplasma sp. P36-A1]|uniref:DUF896 domain-containing protein n=1 Tax=Mycoplasma sp. P36-A1 TaxID=3252900 RepID=UPI003C2D7787
MIEDHKIKRINELAAKAKECELSSEELKEREQLRKEYINAYKKSVTNQLLNVKVVNKHGKDITPEKLKKAKSERKKS